MKSRRDKVTAFAPATVANVAVGFDLLGFALEHVGDEVTLEKRDRKPGESLITIDQITGVGNTESLPTDPKLNVATAGLLELLEDHNLKIGLAVSIKKGIPVASGMGGSAASTVAALVAINALLEKPLSKTELLKYALVGETVASGSGHLDNIAPCLFGGLTLVRESQPLDILNIPVPQTILCVLVHPHYQLETRKARAVLKPDVPLKQHVRQAANLSGFLVGCFREDLALISRSLCDVLIEPQRASLIPGFTAAKQAALSVGALGASISGSGPAAFALVNSLETAHRVSQAMTQAFKASGLECDSWISKINLEGAKIVS